MTDQNQKPTLEQRAKLILQKAREKDAQDCLDAINQVVSENLQKYRCVMFGKVIIAQPGSVIEVTGSGKNFDWGVIALKE